jgi:hypothetical protein
MSVQKQGKKNRKIGRAARKPKTARYNSLHRREYNKLKRILKSNGAEKALEYAKLHNLKFNW